ncbi:PadR family transcriptional regulator [Streptomyces sp. NBC_00193]|uniref:PadR family transcriptional regulator n=1 Tax=unclassified Streptomyces TaxID=2593676 RepID=UPI00225BAAD4|nr:MULTISPECIES: PadR family transcriptional regulator [unclassified Streptomyces]MCX5125821.1 PadR family transcriptional regulator [Streptomyces sp. NBC_00347]MCX5298372.1 PadR family transcriptional regulator [Streptomyces sp. NBC_00193]
MNDQALREPTLLILTAIADAPRHGYAIAQEVEKISEGRTKMRTGTLYGALERLLEQELIAVHEEEVVDGRRRRSYALAPRGREVLAAEAARLARTAQEATRRLGLGGAGASLGASFRAFSRASVRSGRAVVDA